MNSVSTTIAAMVLGVAPTMLLAQQTSDTRGVTDHYLELTLSQRYDDLLEVYAPDATFFDPTGDVFPGPVSDGPVRGAQTIVNMQKGWGLVRSRFDQDVSFTVGEYSIYRGTYYVGYANSPNDAAVPFMTVLRAVNGRITERTDFGEYIKSFGLGDRFEQNTESTRDIAGRYIRAYLDEDLDTQAQLLAEDAIFQDPTSQIYGPPAGQLFHSAQAIIERRRAIYANISGFELEVDEAFAANHHAVYMGTVRYTLASGVTYAQPAAFVVEVHDGKVTRHWDFVDYTVGPVSGG